MLKRSKTNQFRRVSTPQMDDACRTRRVDRESGLALKFGKNPSMIERAVFQDESNFSLQIPTNRQNNRVYFRGKKCDVPRENLYHNSKSNTKKHGVSRVDVARVDKTVLRQRRWNQGECSIVLAAFSCHPEDLPPGRLDFHPRWSVFPHVKSCSRLSPRKLAPTSRKEAGMASKISRQQPSRFLLLEPC